MVVVAVATFSVSCSLAIYILHHCSKYTSLASFLCSLGAAAVISILFYASASPEKTGISTLSVNKNSVFLRDCTQMTVQEGNKSVCFCGILPDSVLWGMSNTSSFKPITLYRFINEWGYYTHTHTHTNAVKYMFKRTLTCTQTQTHTVFLPFKYSNVPNHWCIEIYWISQSDSEYLTHSHCNISSYSISCFSVVVWLKAYIHYFTVFWYCGYYSKFSQPAMHTWLHLLNREHSQPQVLQNLPSLVWSAVS